MLTDRAMSFIQITICAIVAVFIAWRVGFFRVPVPAAPQQRAPNLGKVAMAFFIYLGTLILLIPALADAWFSLVEHVDDAGSTLSDPYIDGWLNFMGICIAAPLLTAYSVQSGSWIWEKLPLSPSNRMHHILIGSATWLIAFPIVTLVAEGLKDLMSLFIESPQIDQVAVRHLKSTFGDIPLQIASMVKVVLIVPIIEEILFRGFIQSWLRSMLTRRTAIFLSALVFTLMHFAWSQGLANVELLAGLFVLSCFLGYLYERQSALWSSIALHCTFNLVSVIFITLGLGG